MVFYLCSNLFIYLFIDFLLIGALFVGLLIYWYTNLCIYLFVYLFMYLFIYVIFNFFIY